MSKLGELKEILKKLIAIPSVTGNEHDIAIYIADYLRQCGVDSVELQPVEGKRLNVVAHLKGEKVDIHPTHVAEVWTSGYSDGAKILICM